MEVTNWTLRNTEERDALIKRLREKLKKSGRKVDTIHGVVSTASVFDEALKALEKELDEQESRK